MPEQISPAFAEAIADAARPHYRGQVVSLSGVLLEADGLPVAHGELCRIERPRLGPVDAEVVGFRGSRALLMPHGELEGIAPGQRVLALGRPFHASVGDELLGRVLDGFGRPLDGGPPPATAHRRSVRAPAPGPMDRPLVDEPFVTGVRSIDGLCTLGKGQRVGIFAGSGVGKSTLLGQVARGSEADVIVVALVGERGREVQGFLEDVLGKEGRSRAATFVATSDRPPIERFLAPFVAVTAAEHFRDKGLDVLLVMDSITRFAAASLEIGLAAGEPPTVRGYPPSFFANVPKLVERMGRTGKGSITGLITVLLDGDDPNEPVADTLRGLLDGHLMLSRDLAQRGHFPAIDPLASLSRLMPAVTSAEHRMLAQAVREDLAVWKEGRDLVEIGAYKAGSNPSLDEALVRVPLYNALLRQAADERSSLPQTLDLFAAAAMEARKA